MAAASFSSMSSLCYYFPCRKRTLLSTVTSSTAASTGNRVSSPIKAAQIASNGNQSRRRTQNVEGDLFVDNSCIDCDTCRWMAPEVFTRVDGMSAVIKQPTCKEERLIALQALVSCPTGSIRAETPPPEILEAQNTFPIPIDEDSLPGVFHCGFHSEKSYGATSYLILHPEGNILVDSPRYLGRLADKIEMLGGVRYMFLTHRDDVADHKKWADRFSSTRILHRGDVENLTADVELKLEGDGPWSIYEDIMLVHTPGHSEISYEFNISSERTQGSVCLFHKPLKALFTGDHVGMTEYGLSIFEQYNQCSVSLQLESLEKLISLDFKWVMPGHGRRVYFKDREERKRSMEALIGKHKQERVP